MLRRQRIQALVGKLRDGKPPAPPQSEDTRSAGGRFGTTTENAMPSMSGTIKRLVSDKGFGFIAAADGNEYFFHQSACQSPFDQLREGQAVTFDKGQGPKGPRAENVKLA